MNFKKLIFIIYIFSSLSGQVITTPQTIKPLVELNPIEDNVLVSFIGIAGQTKKGGAVNYKKAKIYNILKNYTIK